MNFSCYQITIVSSHYANVACVEKDESVPKFERKREGCSFSFYKSQGYFETFTDQNYKAIHKQSTYRNEIVSRHGPHSEKQRKNGNI